MSRLEVPSGNQEEYTIQSLSELYLATVNPNARKNSVHTQNQTQNILANLRRRLSMNPTRTSTSNQTRPSRRSSHAHQQTQQANSPLEMLFRPPNRFFVTQASSEHQLNPQESTQESQDTTQQSGDTFDVKARTESSFSETQRKFLKYQLSSVSKAQNWVNDFLNRPQNPISIIYQLFLCVVLVIYLLLIIFTDRTTWHTMCKPVDFDENEITSNFKGLFEDCLIAHFVIFEWFLRIWSSKARPEFYRVPWHKYIFKYHYSFSHILDLFIVLAGSISATCWFPLPLDITQDVYAAIVLRGLHRLFMVAEWTSVQARHSPIELIMQVFHEQGAILFGIFYLQLMLILVVAYVVFHAERHSPDADHQEKHLSNMLDALYWATISLLTIGYGEKVPKTYIGKAVTGFGIVIGMALFSLPAGIIATSLAIKISERDAIELRHLKRTYAATIIQRIWRFRQREKRFQKAILIVSRNPDLQDRDEIELQVTVNRTFRTKHIKQPKIIHLNPKLREQLVQVSTRRFEFYCSQFIEILKLKYLCRKFMDLIKRQQGGASQLANSWQVIKAHWIEHQQLTVLLEKTNEMILNSVDQVTANRASSKQDAARNKARLHEYNKIQADLYDLYYKLCREREALEKMAMVSQEELSQLSDEKIGTAAK